MGARMVSTVRKAKVQRLGRGIVPRRLHIRFLGGFYGSSNGFEGIRNRGC